MQTTEKAGNWGNSNWLLKWDRHQQQSMQPWLVPDAVVMEETFMHQSDLSQSKVRSSAFTDILHLKGLISPWCCLQGKI